MVVPLDERASASDRSHAGGASRLPAVLAVAAGVWFLALYVLPPLGVYARFGLRNFDYGMVFQSSDLLARAEALFMSCRGVHAWADNQDYLQVLFAPFHWLPRPHQALLLVHALGAFAPGLICLATVWRGDRWSALAVAVLAWASPFMIDMNLDLLHIETLATAVLLGMYLAARRGSAAGFHAALLAALAAKEDVALTTGLLMVLFLLERRRFRLARGHFALGLALSVVVFFVNLKLVLPHYKVATCLWLDPDAAVEAMDSVPAALAYAEVLQSWYKPAFLGAMFLRAPVALYVLSLVWPLCFFLRRPSWLWLGPAAAVFVNVVSSSDHLITGHYHYDFASFAAVLICVLEGLRESRPSPARALALATVALGVNLATPTLRAPLHAPADPATWDLAPVLEVRFLEELDRLLPVDAVVSADERSMCYLLEERSQVYMFKNPFETHFFGLYDQCTEFATPPEVDLVLLRRELERRLDRIEELVPEHHLRVDDGTGPFLVWLGPSFAASDAGRATAELAREGLGPR